MLYRTPLVSLSADLEERIPLLPSKVELGATVLLTATEWSALLPFPTIVLATDVAVDADLEKKTIVCYQEEWLPDWLDAPVSSGTYLIDGFKGLRKFYFHVQLRGWTLDYRATDVDYHKIDLREESAMNYGRIHSKIKSCLDPKASREYLAKNRLANVPNASLFVPSCIPLEGFTLVKGNVYILKPVGVASSGAGITVFSNNEEYRKACAKIRGKWKEGVVCRYIDNPLLFQGKKFHLRCYLFVATAGVWSLYPDAKILTAGAPYKKGNYTSSLIHDTHARTTPANYFFRQEFSQEEQKRIWPSVEFIAESVAACPFAGYPDADVSYDVLGLDILVDDTWHCWLLEANFAPSMDPITYEGYDQFEKSFFEWEVALTLPLA